MDGPPIGVDPAGALQPSLGRAGLSRSAWRELRPRGLAAVREIDEAVEAGLVPHLLHARDTRLGSAVGKLVRTWRPAERLVLLGDAGAVAGAAVLGVPDGTVLLSDPAAAMEADVRGAGLIVLGSAPWVVACRRMLGDMAAQVWQVDGDGTASTSPRRKGQRRIQVAGGADVRFVTCSPIALALAVLGGAEPDGLVRMLHSVGDALCSRARAENPALAIAALATGLLEVHGRGAPALLVPAGLLETARHGARIWQAFTTRPRPAPPGWRAPAGVPIAVSRGDEAAAAPLLHGPGDLWVVQVTGGCGTAGRLDDAWKRALMDAGTPTVQVGGASATPEKRLALLGVLTHAALLTALQLQLEPLALPGADRLREVQRTRGLDSP
ncbi:MAG: hypothetical protein VX265_13310 [Myxococcota bacterium]|nr:hypothetical protein [Myxococcota bacterium]